MSDKKTSNFLSIMIFAVFIMGAILFAYYEFGGCLDMTENSSRLFYILLLLSVLLVIASACVLVFSPRDSNIGFAEPIATSYLLSQSKDDTEKYDLTISKTDDAILLCDKCLNKIDKIIIEDNFIDLPKEVLDKIKGKNITITHNTN